MPKQRLRKQGRRKYRTRRRRHRHRRRKTASRKLSGGVNSPKSDDLSFAFPDGDQYDHRAMEDYLRGDIPTPATSNVPTPATSGQQKTRRIRNKKPLTPAQKEVTALARQRSRWFQRAKTLRTKKAREWRRKMGLGSDSAVTPYDDARAPWDADDDGSLAVNLMEEQSNLQSKMGNTWGANTVIDRDLPAWMEQVPAHGTGIVNEPTICGRTNPNGDGTICSKPSRHASACRFR